MRLPTKAVVLIVLLGMGCSADLEALYADEQALIALLPAKPDDEVAAVCGMCAKQACEEQRLVCEKDELCSKLLDCKSKCSDPACLFECEADFEVLGEHNNFYTCMYESECTGDPDCADECEAEHQAAETYDAYRACVFDDECREECAAGENWQCLGKYSWIPSDTAPTDPLGLTIMVKDIDRSNTAFPGAAGVIVLACLSSDNCSSGVRATSNTLGIAEFEKLPSNDDNGFQGYFSFEDRINEDDGIFQIHEIGRPIHRELTMEEVDIPNTRYWDDTKELLDVEPMRTFSYIKARVYDCLNTPAPGVTFSLPNDEDAIGFYSHSTYKSPGSKTDQTGIGGFVGVRTPNEGTSIVFRAVRSGDEVSVSEKVIGIGRGVITRIELYPSAKEP